MIVGKGCMEMGGCITYSTYSIHLQFPISLMGHNHSATQNKQILVIRG